MEINKSQKRLFILLGLVLIYFVYDIISDWDTYAGFYTGKKTVTVQKAEEKKAENMPEEEVEQDRPYLAKWGRNPFYQKVQVKKAAVVTRKKKRSVRLNLYAISIKDNNSVALINDRIVKIGDMIGGYTLKKINKKSVLLTDGAKAITLKLDTY